MIADKPRLIEKHELYYFTTCPYCIAVRLVMWRLRLSMPLKNIMTDAVTRADLLNGGGKEQVPCLRIEDDNGGVRWMYESADIIRYLRTRFS